MNEFDVYLDQTRRCLDSKWYYPASDSLGNVFRSRLTACSLDEPCDAADRAMKIARHFTEICDALLVRLHRKTATSRAQSPLFTRRTQGLEADAVGLAGAAAAGEAFGRKGLAAGEDPRGSGQACGRQNSDLTSVLS
jgi:hypothetical protein